MACVSGSADDRRDEARRAQLAMRVGTAERERAVAELRDHFTVGRLTTEELEERTRDAFAARTVGDLARVLQDLPVEGSRVPVEPGRRRAPTRSAVPLLALVPVVLAVLLLTGSGAAGLRVLFVAVLAVVVVRLVQRGL